jgi:hypothetical protein
MSVVHNHPHPMAQQVIQPQNAEIYRKFGAVRVEDWADRVLGDTPGNLRQRSEPVDRYEATSRLPGCTGMPDDDEIVACHTVLTGERVLLHDLWL